MLKQTEFTGPWQECRQDCTVLLTRSVNELDNQVFEYVFGCARDGQDAKAAHGWLDIRDYVDTEAGMRHLDVIAACMGYESFDDFVLSGIPSPNVTYLPDGSLDRINSPDYVIDLMATAELIINYRFAGRDCDELIPMTTAEAEDFIRVRTGEEVQLR